MNIAANNKWHMTTSNLSNMFQHQGLFKRNVPMMIMLNRGVNQRVG